MLNSYKELIVWQKAINLVEEIYFLTTKLPKLENFGLISQMRRAAISIPSNIAEGQKRKNLGEFLQFLRIADGSAAELETQLTIAKRLYKDLNSERGASLLEEIQKMLNVIIRKLESNDLKSKNYKLKTNSGFTMIELLVAITLFVVVIAVSSGVFVQSLRSQRQTVELMAKNDNASLVLEQMIREIRTGFEFRAAGGGRRLEFVNHRGEPTTYELEGGAVLRNGRPLTAKNVKVERMSFILFGAEAGDGLSTRVTILFTVGTTNLQTTVSVRNLDS